jgi:hypothetical protein
MTNTDWPKCVQSVSLLPDKLEVNHQKRKGYPKVTERYPSKARTRTQILLPSNICLLTFLYTLTDTAKTRSCPSRLDCCICPLTVLFTPSLNTSSPSSTWLPRWFSKVQIRSCSLCCSISFRGSHGYRIEPHDHCSNRWSTLPLLEMPLISFPESICYLGSDFGLFMPFHAYQHSSCSLYSTPSHPLLLG